MQCPICKQTSLTPGSLENNLSAHKCQSCHGIWLQANDYLGWRSQQGDFPPPDAASPDVSISAEDVAKAKICPQDGHFLLRYKVGKDITFALDRCGTCNGVWFDPKEWDVLKSRHLHGEIHNIFTDPWQRQVRQEEQRRSIQLFYQGKLGEEDYAELRRIKAWIGQHPERSALLAYLTDRDPYKL